MPKLRVGIVGLGWVAAHRHLPCWRHVGAEIVSICTHNLSPEIAKTLGVAHVTTQLEDLIKIKPDVVSICTPPQVHFEQARMLIESGIPVLLEKPLVTTIAEAEALRTIAQRCGVPICPAYALRFCRAVRRAWDLLASGEAGELLHIAAFHVSSFTRRLPSWYGDLPGGLYWDVAPHMLYLLDAILGNIELTAAHINWGSSTAPRTVSAELSGEHAVGSMHAIFGSGANEWHIVIVTTRAVIDIDCYRDICIVFPSDGAHGRVEVARTSLNAAMQHVLGLTASGWKYIRGRLHYGLDELIKQFAERLEPPVDLDEGLRTVYLAHEILARNPAPAKEGSR